MRNYIRPLLVIGALGVMLILGCTDGEQDSAEALKETELEDGAGELYITDFAIEDPIGEAWAEHGDGSYEYVVAGDSAHVRMNTEPGSGHTFRLRYESPWNNVWQRNLGLAYILQTRIKISDLGRWRSFSVQFNGPSDASRYRLVLGAWDDDHNVTIERTGAEEPVSGDNNKSSVFQDSAISETFKNEWVPLVIVFQGANIDVYLNQEHIIQYYDEEPLYGDFGLRFYVWGSDVAIDYVNLFTDQEFNQEAKHSKDINGVGDATGEPERVDKAEVLPEQPKSPRVNTIVTVSPGTLLSIDGKSVLDRTKYFNLCTTGWNNFFNNVPFDEAEYLLSDLNVSLGRALGHMRGRGEGAPEDPARPGFVDPNFYNTLARTTVADNDPVQRFFPDNLDVILHGSRQIEWPSFMSLVDDGINPKLPANVEAAAEFLVEGLIARYDDYTMPRYYELFNEPNWRRWRVPELHKIYSETAKRVREAGLNVLVGGPCLSVPYFFQSDYGSSWEGGLKHFIDHAGVDMDFVSFHIYDFYGTDGVENITTGLPLENVFDLVAAYTKRELGKALPIAVSEQGAAGPLFGLENDPPEQWSDSLREMEGKVTREQMEWWHMNSLNGQFMTFLNRPASLVKAVPFTLVTTDSWNPSYVWALYVREDYDRSRPYYRTSLIQFYQLWKDVKGFRVEAHSNDPDVQVSAFVHDNELYVALNNLASVEKHVDLSLDSVHPQQATISRLYFDGERSQLVEDASVDNWQGLDIAADETLILRLQYSDAVLFEESVNEQTYYSEKIAEPIDRRSILHDIEIGSGKEYKYAYLRVGISRPHQLSWDLRVSFNGSDLAVPKASSDDKQLLGPEYATTKIVQVPVELLSSNNTIRLQFSDIGGAIGAVALVVAEHQELGQYYKEAVLPEEFNALAPKTEALSPEGLQFSWEAATGADSYQIVLAEDREFEQVVIDKYVSEPNVTMSTLDYGSKYFWQVRAMANNETENVKLQRWNSNGIQSFSTTDVARAPNTPEIDSLRDGIGIVTVSWQPVEYANRYNIYRQGLNETQYELIASGLERTTKNYSDELVVEGKSYSYFVTAENQLGESEKGKEAEVSVREITNVIELDFSALDERWEPSGAWSEPENKTGANLRALFPRAFGSIKVSDILSDSYLLQFGLRLNEIGNPNVAILRISLNMRENERYQLMYWFGRNEWELVKRTDEGNFTLVDKEFSLSSEKWYNMQFINRHGNMELVINDSTIFSITDAHPLLKGDIEIYATNVDLDLVDLFLQGH